MNAVLIALILTAPVVALTTGVYLWGRRHSTPNVMRCRVLQAALVIVSIAAMAYVVLLVRQAQGEKPRAAQLVTNLGAVGVAVAYLANELSQTGKRWKKWAATLRSYPNGVKARSVGN